MEHYPGAQDLFWPGHLHGTGCLSARAIDTWCLTIVSRLCLCLGFTVTSPISSGVYGVCFFVSVFAAPRQSWLVFVVCAFGLGFRLHPANPGWVVRVCVFVRVICQYPIIPGWCLWCMCLGTDFFYFTPPSVAGVRGVGVCVWVGVLASPPGSRLGC